MYWAYFPTSATAKQVQVGIVKTTRKPITVCFGVLWSFWHLSILPRLPRSLYIRISPFLSQAPRVRRRDLPPYLSLCLFLSLRSFYGLHRRNRDPGFGSAAAAISAGIDRFWSRLCLLPCLRVFHWIFVSALRNHRTVWFTTFCSALYVFLLWFCGPDNAFEKSFLFFVFTRSEWIKRKTPWLISFAIW